MLLVNTTEEHTLGHLKELHIRSFVLVGLARIYIENGHEDMIKLGLPAGDTPDDRRQSVLQRYKERVRHLYPPSRFGDPDDPSSNGGVLQEMAELARATQTKQRSDNHGADTAFENKNAVGPDAASVDDLRTLFDTERPKNNRGGLSR